jgi:hypothetical protein
VSAAGPLTVTLTSDDLAIAGLTTQTLTATSPVTITIPVNTYQVGGVELDPLGGGTMTVTASAPDFVSSVQSVTVSQPAITVPDTYVGNGLQTAYRVYLGGSQHGGVTVTLTSEDPALLMLAASPTDVGASTIDVIVANGPDYFEVYLQGVSGASGPATLTVTSPLFTTDTATISVNASRLVINYLATSTTTLSSNDAFQVWTQVESYTGGGNWYVQAVSAAGPLTVTLTSDDLAVAGLTTLSGTATSPVTVTIPVNTYASPSTVAAGGVEFDPDGAGNVDITATAPNFVDGTQNVTVDP